VTVKKAVKKTIYLSNIAEQDIVDIALYLMEHNIHAANKFIDALYDAFDELNEHPLIGHTREDLTQYPVRFWTFKWHYLIVYKSSDPIEIVRVLSGYQDIACLLE
jgi:plasmid stabilization system protein ParE